MCMLGNSRNVYIYTRCFEKCIYSVIKKYVYSVNQKIRILGDSRNAYSRWFMSLYTRWFKKCIYSLIKQIKILGDLRSVYTRWFDKFIYSVIWEMYVLGDSRNVCTYTRRWFNKCIYNAWCFIDLTPIS